MTDHPRFRGPSLDVDVPEPDGYSWFTTVGMVLPTDQWRSTTSGPWNEPDALDDLDAFESDRWVQVRRSPHPQPDAVLYTSLRHGAECAAAEAEHQPVTFAELHATIDTSLGATNVTTTRRLALARAVWARLTSD